MDIESIGYGLGRVAVSGQVSVDTGDLRTVIAVCGGGELLTI